MFYLLRLAAMSPAPSDILGAGQHAYPQRAVYPMRPMQQVPPETDAMYQKWLENQQYGEPQATARPLDMQTFAQGGCRMQNMTWQAQYEDFNALCDMQNGLDSNAGVYHCFPCILDLGKNYISSLLTTLNIGDLKVRHLGLPSHSIFNNQCCV